MTGVGASREASESDDEAFEWHLRSKHPCATASRKSISVCEAFLRKIKQEVGARLDLTMFACFGPGQATLVIFVWSRNLVLPHLHESTRAMMCVQEVSCSVALTWRR